MVFEVHLLLTSVSIDFRSTRAKAAALTGMNETKSEAKAVVLVPAENFILSDREVDYCV